MTHHNLKGTEKSHLLRVTHMSSLAKKVVSSFFRNSEYWSILMAVEVSGHPGR